MSLKLARKKSVKDLKEYQETCRNLGRYIVAQDASLSNISGVKRDAEISQPFNITRTPRSFFVFTNNNHKIDEDWSFIQLKEPEFWSLKECQMFIIAANNGDILAKHNKMEMLEVIRQARPKRNDAVVGKTEKRRKISKNIRGEITGGGSIEQTGAAAGLMVTGTGDANKTLRVGRTTAAAQAENFYSVKEKESGSESVKPLAATVPPPEELEIGNRRRTIFLQRTANILPPVGEDFFLSIPLLREHWLSNEKLTYVQFYEFLVCLISYHCGGEPIQLQESWPYPVGGYLPFHWPT